MRAISGVAGLASSSLQPVGARNGRGPRHQFDHGKRVLRSAPVTSLHINGTPDPHSANDSALDAGASLPSRGNLVSRIHNAPSSSPMVADRSLSAAGHPTASSQPICNVPAPSLHPYLGRMRHSQCHDLLLWSLWVGRPRQEGMAVRRNVHRFIFAVAFDLPDLRHSGASNDEGFRPGGAC